MLKIARIVFSVIAFVLALYALFTQDFRFSSYMIFFVGATLLISGIGELKENRKLSAYALFAVAAFGIFVSVYTAL